MKSSFENCCGSCTHFYMHYVRFENGRYIPIDFGHCAFPRIKDREAYTKACKYYEVKEEETGEA